MAVKEWKVKTGFDYEVRTTGCYWHRHLLRMHWQQLVALAWRAPRQLNMFIPNKQTRHAVVCVLAVHPPPPTPPTHT